MAEPIRTCIGCRARAPKAELIRLVFDPARDEVVLDPTKRMPGRGAHLHNDPHCLDLAVRRRAFTRALRRTGEIALSAELIERPDVPVGD